MKIKQIALACAFAGFAATAGAYTMPTLTNADGTLSPFGGFDWASGAAAWTSGFIPEQGKTFDLYYAGWAVAVNNTGSGTLFTPYLDTNANGTSVAAGAYEYTIFAHLTETVVSVDPSTNTATFKVTGGSFDIYYDVAANAKQSNGTGFLDGVKILSGTVFANALNTFTDATGGQATLNGMVTYTNNTYVNPAMVGTNLTSTLQLGSAVTSFNTPTGFDFDNNGSSDVLGAPGVVIFQADANQSFSQIPEPDVIALVGLGLIGMYSSRRRKIS